MMSPMVDSEVIVARLRELRESVLSRHGCDVIEVDLGMTGVEVVPDPEGGDPFQGSPPPESSTHHDTIQGIDMMGSEHRMIFPMRSLTRGPHRYLSLEIPMKVTYGNKKGVSSESVV